jgi:pimeloyl-ACP methyl ester carboxylesterase
LAGLKTHMLVNGHNLLVEQHGPQNRPAVVLLHHGLGSVMAWKEQIPLLVNAGWRAVVYDRWGYGGSDTRPALDLPGFAADLADLQAILAITGIQRAALVGQSDGGTIALYFAIQHPKIVTCLVLVAAHIYVELKMEPSIIEIKRAFEHDERFRSGLRRAHGEKYESTFRNWFNGWHHIESLSWDMRPILSQVRCPTLVVQGKQDEHATPQHARDIADAIPQAELWLVTGARHMLPQEHADQFNPRLLEFLDLHRDG